MSVGDFKARRRGPYEKFMNASECGVLMRKLLSAALLSCVLLRAGALASVAGVWAVNDGEKVERDDLNNPNGRGNSAWDGRTVRIFGARNEVIAFQVIVEAGREGIKSLTARLPELRLRGGGARIAYAPPAADPTEYVGRPIQVFSVNYMNVTEPTHASWVFKPGSPAAPKDPTGWKPGGAAAAFHLRLRPHRIRPSGSTSTRPATCRRAHTAARSR
jgi:hypothetical protein